MITKQIVAAKLTDYLYHHLTLDALVEWAEGIILDGDLDPAYAALLKQIVGRIGVSDVRAFGLSWEDCEQMLNQLGYTASIDIKAA